MAHYVAYTDGSCNNLSPFGEGGSAYVILKDGILVKEAAKGFMGTTNNRVEMLAIISAVRSIQVGDSITIYTDSSYCIDILGKRKKIKEKTKNKDLIALYDTAAEWKMVAFKWVKGHSGDYWNEYVDKLSNGCTERMRVTNDIQVYNTYNSPKVRKAETI